MPSSSRKPRLKPVDTWTDYQTLFVGHLEAINRAPLTIRTYNIALEQLIEFMRPRGVVDPQDVTRDDLTAWLRYLAKAEPEGRGLSAASVAQRYRSIQAFFKFMVKQEGLPESPLEGLEQPKVPESLVPVIPRDHLQKLMDAVKGRTFEDRRDRAIISLFVDTGARLAEVAGLTLDQVDLESREIRVLGKGRKHRLIGFVSATKQDLLRYVMERRSHAHADNPAFFLGRRGALGASGIHQMLQRRCAQAGIPLIHAHQFRHTFAHEYLLQGGNEGDLMRETGWTSRSMVDRYGRSAGSQRARARHDEHSPRRLLR